MAVLSPPRRSAGRHHLVAPVPSTATTPGWRLWHPPARRIPVAAAAIERVTVLMPAHDEEAQIRDGIDSLVAQTRVPDRVIVICDNCTDRTAEIAAEVPGVEIVHTAGNTAKKAGALNQVLDALLPTMSTRDAILVMDADSELDPGFVAAAVARLGRGDVSAVGGTFRGKAGGGFVGMLQRNEYARYARDVRRQQGHTLVLTGTATLFRADLLADVIRARISGRLPGTANVYDTSVLTEDNELTLAVLTLGHGIVAPKECTLATEVMSSWGALFRQRLRWKRGALENLGQYGWSRVTAEYWVRQAVALIGLLVITGYLGTVAWSLIAVGSLQIYPLWLAITAIFALERAVTVRARGPAMMLLGAVIVVEMVFDVVLQFAQATAFLQAALHTERRW